MVSRHPGSADATLDVSGGVTIALADSGTLSISQTFLAAKSTSKPGKVSCKSETTKSKLRMKANKSSPGTFLVKAKLAGSLPAVPATLAGDLTLTGSNTEMSASTTDCEADNDAKNLRCGS